MSEIEKFVKENLIYINRMAGIIEYNYEGDNYEQEFNINPLVGIRAAIKRIKKWDKGEE